MRREKKKKGGVGMPPPLLENEILVIPFEWTRVLFFNQSFV